VLKFHILIFGCQMNYADSARIKAILINCWFSYTEDIKKADIVIFDTCSVRQKSEDKITWKLKEIWKHQKVWITGCMIQHNLRNSKLKIKNWTKWTPSSAGENLKTWNFLWTLKSINPQIIWLSTQEINNNSKLNIQNSTFIPVNNAFNPIFHNLTQKRKNIELFRRIDDTWFLPLILKKFWYEISYDKEILNEYEKILPIIWNHQNKSSGIIPINTSMNAHTRTAYIPISTWCNQFCSYCIVPYARGLEKNFPVKQIVDEAKVHLKNWTKEIVLIWQIVNKHPDFVKIIKEILKLPWLKWLRYTSPYPTFYSPQLLQLHEKESKLCPHIHIPLQSWSDNILKKMFRWYDSKQCYQFIDKIRKLKKQISITTDIIVWFPWETEKDFKQTLKLIEYWNFDMIYIGIYSPRPWTLADRKYPNDIPYKTKHSRRSRLNNLLIKISKKNNLQEIWTIKTVLINEISKDWIFWYDESLKQIIIHNKFQNIRIWDFVKVKITDWIPFKLKGEMLKRQNDEAIKW